MVLPRQQPGAPSVIDYARESARLQVQKESLEAECERLQLETARLAALVRALETRVAIATAESTRATVFLDAIRRSRPWRVTEFLRGLVGRRWGR